MIIDSIEAAPVNFKLKKEFKFGERSLSDLKHVIVKIETEKGLIGLGEAPTYKNPRPVTQKSLLRSIRSIKDEIEGLKATQINKVNQICRENIEGQTSAQSSLEMALYDIVGKKLEVPVYNLLGGEKQTRFSGL